MKPMISTLFSVMLFSLRVLDSHQVLNGAGDNAKFLVNKVLDLLDFINDDTICGSQVWNGKCQFAWLSHGSSIQQP